MKEDKLIRSIERMSMVLDRENDRAIELINTHTGEAKRYWQGYSSGLDTACKELTTTIRFLRGVSR